MVDSPAQSAQLGPGWFGPYRLIRELEPLRLGPRRDFAIRRWAAVHERDGAGRLVYSMRVRDRFEARRFLAAAERAASLTHPHILHLESFSMSDRLGGCLVTPYPGHQGGIYTLAGLVGAKGQLTIAEVHRGLTHVLQAFGAAHTHGLADGSLSMDRVLVDPRGSLLLELPGLWRSLWRRGEPEGEIVRNDVRAVAEMGLLMLTPPQSVGNIASHLGPAWRAWLTRGLDPVEGFASAEEALAKLPAPNDDQVAENPGVVRLLLGRLRAAIGLR